MEQGMRSLVLSAIVLACSFGLAHGDEARVTVAGVVLDAAHHPIDGPATITFTVYDVPDGGAPLHAETQTVTASRGEFAASLGAAAGLDAKLDVVWVSAHLAGEPETPARA